MDVAEIFKGISSMLLAEFDQVQHQIPHLGERGTQRENSLATLLQKYLPGKFSMGTGQVLDIRGNISRQCDIVIYDALNCPLLLAEEGYQLFPAESVFGVVQVKSVYDASTAADAVQNIASVKLLERDQPIAGAIFAFRSRYKREPKIVTAANALRRLNNTIAPEARVDLVCILADGVLSNYKSAPDWGRSGSGLLAVLEAAPSNLLLFLYWLIEILEERESFMPDLVGYATGGEIGVVTLLSSAACEESEP